MLERTPTRKRGLRIADKSDLGGKMKKRCGVKEGEESPLKGTKGESNEGQGGLAHQGP